MLVLYRVSCVFTVVASAQPLYVKRIIVIIIKNLFPVGYNTIVYRRPGKLIHTIFYRNIIYK